MGNETNEQDSTPQQDIPHDIQATVPPSGTTTVHPAPVPPTMQECQRAYIEGLSQPGLKEVMVTKVLKESATSFSWLTLLFGVFYLAYRKCYTAAVVLGLFNYVASWILGLVSEGVDLLLSLALGIVTGFLFYPYYRYKMKREIAELQKSSDDTSLLMKVRQTGGTNIAALFLVFGIIFLMATIEVILFGSQIL